jgi:23S rRNA (uracil1939-C5)-methyltransferase
MLIFVVDTHLQRIESALSTMTASMPEIVSIYQKLGGKNSDIDGRTGSHVKYELMEGKPYIREMINGLAFDISPGSFFQVNSVQAGVLFAKTVEYASSKGTIVDAYCGTGSISLFLANQAEKVCGIESFPDAILDARHNAAINGIGNVEFILGDTGKTLDQLGYLGPEAIVVDPPRAGCDSKALDGISRLNPEKIVYVSCNPATLARDLKYLVEKGYSVIEAQPIDMFPQTYHVECAVLITRV